MDAPVTKPVPAPTDATPVALLLQVPPPVLCVSNIPKPKHISDGPSIAAGDVFTVISRVREQPAAFVKLIVATPALAPVTIPVLPTVAIPVLLLLQVPLPVPVTATVEPTHTLVPPPSGAGNASTDTTIVATQPSHVVYDIIVVLAAIPVTMPVLPTVAAAGLLLLQVPHSDVLPNVVVEPAHTLAVPVIDGAAGLTVTKAFTWQPVATVYVIAAVPADTPVTIPDVLPTVATPVLPLTHDTPPPVALLRAVVLPAHTTIEPVIADGSALTVSDFVR